jgi:diguanylate cyclase (GGDEF)-like protein
MTMLNIDLDYFKKINDTHGHIIGDRVLVEVAGLIGKALRVSDHIARFGGEEFVVLLPETGLDRALQIAERILGCAGIRCSRFAALHGQHRCGLPE